MHTAFYNWQHIQKYSLTWSAYNNVWATEKEAEAQREEEANVRSQVLSLLTPGPFHNSIQCLT